MSSQSSKKSSFGQYAKQNDSFNMDQDVFGKLFSSLDTDALKLMIEERLSDEEKSKPVDNPMEIVRRFLDITFFDDEQKEAANHVISGGCIAELYGIDDEQLNAIYALAYGHYQSGKYDEACYLLHILCLLNNWNSIYFHALGNAQVALKRFNKAYENYAMAIMNDADNPIYYFHMGEAYLMDHKTSEAIDAFFGCMQRCVEGNSLHDDLKNMCKSKIKLIKSKSVKKK